MLFVPSLTSKLFSQEFSMLRKLIKFQEKENVKNTAVISKENQSLQNSIKK